MASVRRAAKEKQAAASGGGASAPPVAAPSQSRPAPSPDAGSLGGRSNVSSGGRASPTTPVPAPTRTPPPAAKSSPPDRSPTRPKGGGAALAASPTSFRATVRKRLLDDVIGGTGGNETRWRVMVLDERATRVVSSIVGMYDMMEARVTVVEDLNRVRQPFPQMDAIYVVLPTAASVARIKQDFPNNKEALYREAHLFFLDRVPDDVLASLQECRVLLARTKTFKEINLNFLAPEAQVFHLDVGLAQQGPSLYRQLYRSQSGAVVRAMAEKLVTVCATLNEFPHVRYARDSSRATALAHEFQSNIQTFINNSPQWVFRGQSDGEGGERGRATLLVLDRAADPLSPLIHEFTYQCLAYDLLPVSPDGLISYEVETGQGRQLKQVVLSDNDELWAEFRHQHIGAVLDELGRRFKELVGNNAGAAALVKGQGKQMSVEEMARATRGLPEFQEMSKKMSQHINIAQQCMAKVTSLGLLKVGALEQAMVLGTDDAGKKRGRKDFLNGYSVDADDQPGLLELLASPRMVTEMKLRLLALYIMSQKGLTEEDRDSLMTAARLSDADAEVLTGLEFMGVNMGEPTEEKKKGGMFNFKFGGGSSTSRAPAEESPYALMRYTTPMKETVRQLITGDLSLAECPSVLPLPEPETDSARHEAAAAKSIRKGARGRADAAPSGFTGARVIVFVIGGVTYSEARAMYELMLQHNREVVVGSTAFLSPKAFLTDVKGLL